MISPFRTPVAVRRDRGESERRTIGGNILWGVSLGLGLAALFSLYVIAVFIFRPRRIVQEYGITLGGMILTYFVAGIGGGLIVGLMRPLARRASGAIATGIVAATFVYGAIGVALEGPIAKWERGKWVVPILLGLFTGTIAGYRTWEDEVEPTLPRAQPEDLPSERARYRRWPR